MPLASTLRTVAPGSIIILSVLVAGSGRAAWRHDAATSASLVRKKGGARTPGRGNGDPFRSIRMMSDSVYSVRWDSAIDDFRMVPLAQQLIARPRHNPHEPLSGAAHAKPTNKARQRAYHGFRLHAKPVVADRCSHGTQTVVSPARSARARPKVTAAH